MVRSFSFYFLFAGSVALYLLDPFVKISSIDFLPSDVFFILSFLFLLLSKFGFWHFNEELWANPGIVPFWVFLLSGFFGFLLTATQRRVVPSFHLFSALQLFYIFVVIYPLVQVHKNSIAKARKLWSVHLWLIPFAGLLSVTDLLGLTNLGQDFGERHYNAILDTTFVNGFWLFALASPFLLQKLFPFRWSSVMYGALWFLGCAGTILAGSRAALGVAFLSVLFIVWLNRRRIFSDARMFVGFVSFLGVLLGAGLLLNSFPVIINRFVEAQDFFQAGKDDYSVSARSDQITIVLNEWAREPLSLAGRGFKQYRVIHPDDPAESIHNIYLQQLYDTGFIGFVAFLVIFAAYFRWCSKLCTDARERGDSDAVHYWRCCQFVVLAYLVLGLAHPIGYYRNFWLPLFLAIPSFQEYRKLVPITLQVQHGVRLDSPLT